MLPNKTMLPEDHRKVTIIARWEHTHISPAAEWKIWELLQLFRVYQIICVPKLLDTEYKHKPYQFETMEEAFEEAGAGNRVFMEPNGTKTLSELPSRDEDVIFIFGNAANSNMEYAEEDETYRLVLPVEANLYGVSAGAIVLSHWVGQE